MQKHYYNVTFINYSYYCWKFGCQKHRFFKVTLLGRACSALMEKTARVGPQDGTIVFWLFFTSVIAQNVINCMQIFYKINNIKRLCSPILTLVMLRQNVFFSWPPIYLITMGGGGFINPLSPVVFFLAYTSSK